MESAKIVILAGALALFAGVGADASAAEPHANVTYYSGELPSLPSAGSDRPHVLY